MEPWLIEKLLLIVVLVGASGFFAGTETSLFSLSHVKREAMQSRNDALDGTVLRLLANPRRLMVTLILGNELVNIALSSTMAGLGVHAFAALGLRQRLLVTIGTALCTLPLVVMFGDMTPKSIAIRAADRWARAAARPLEVFGWIVAPLRITVRLVSESLLWLVGGRPPTREEGLREEEFRALVDVGEQEGEVENAERKLIHNVFEFGDRTVFEVMTPGDKVFALPYEMPLGRIVEAVAASRFSRVPIYRRGAKGTLGQVVGVLHAKDLIGYRRGHLEGHTLQDLLRPPFFVPRSTKCDRLFREFQRRKTHMAQVVDEYGRLIGVVTMENLLEELFGEIGDEKGAVEAPPLPPLEGALDPDEASAPAVAVDEGKP